MMIFGEGQASLGGFMLEGKGWSKEETITLAWFVVFLLMKGAIEIQNDG